MDVAIYTKEKVVVPDDATWSLVPEDVCDFKPIFNEGATRIDNLETLTDEEEEITQQAVFASLQQRGSDPLDETYGVRWAEYFLGEITAEQLMQDIKNAVSNVSSGATAIFSTEEDDDGNEKLVYTIKVVV